MIQTRPTAPFGRVKLPLLVKKGQTTELTFTLLSQCRHLTRRVTALLSLMCEPRHHRISETKNNMNTCRNDSNWTLLCTQDDHIGLHVTNNTRAKIQLTL